VELKLNRHRRAKHGVRATLWSAVSIMGLVLVALPATGILPPLLLYNPSASAPLGWYRIEAIDGISRGELVVANLPNEAAEFAAQRGYLPSGIPVIKTVRALEGDWVCQADGLLQINGIPAVRALPADKAGRPLPSPWKTCQQLQSDEVLLLSDRTPDSFDGRYFGRVLKTDILGKAIPLGGVGFAAEIADREQFDGDFECKIKAHGANEGLHPCLHIDFYGSTDRHAALPSDGNLNGGNRLAWFHTGNRACFPPEHAE
jgi:conjugative transfer signal peptidase TraF